MHLPCKTWKLSVLWMERIFHAQKQIGSLQAVWKGADHDHRALPEKLFQSDFAVPAHLRL